MSGHYEVDEDYGDPYWDPSSKEDELRMQLLKLKVQEIPREDLQWVEKTNLYISNNVFVLLTIEGNQMAACVYGTFYHTIVHVLMATFHNNGITQYSLYATQLHNDFISIKVHIGSGI